MRRMRVIAHGIDLVDIARIEAMLAEHGRRFAERCFTDREQVYAEASPRQRAQRYAARFACKEAVLKALGTGWREGISWRDIEVIREPSGRPGLVLAGRCRELAGELRIDAWHLSLSHTPQCAVATAAYRSREAERYCPTPAVLWARLRLRNRGLVLLAVLAH